LRSEDYWEFLRIVHEFTPEAEDEVRQQLYANTKMAVFAQAFERRYFPLYPSFTDGLGEEYEQLTNFIPLVLRSINADAYSDLATGGYDLGFVLAAYLNADPYEDYRGEERISLGDACLKDVPQEILTRVPDGGFRLKDLHMLLDGTRFEGLAIVGDVLNFATDNCFYDNDEESVAQGGEDLEWTRKNVEFFTSEWLKSEDIDNKMGHFCGWLKEAPSAHFEELLNFIETRHKALPRRVVPRPQFHPSQSDRQWLFELVKNLSLGGIWKAPMGFTFEKVGEHKIRLKEFKLNNPKELNHVLEAIGRTVIVGESLGIEVDTEILEGGEHGTNAGTASPPAELAAVAGSTAGPVEGQARLL
jgi:hypothetical protein